MLRESFSAQVASVILLVILLIICHLTWLTKSRPTFRRAHFPFLLLIFEDSEAAIRMSIRERSPTF